MSFYIRSSHTRLPVETNRMHYISVDPGEVNLAFRIERRTFTGVSTLIQEKWIIEFGKGCNFWLKNLHRLLGQHEELYKSCQILAIEEQICSNTRMMGIYTAIICYFIHRHPNIVVVGLSPKLKGRIFGLVGLSRSELKKRTIQVAVALSKSRGDDIFLEILASRDKKDDDADSLVQLEAFCSHVGYRTTQP